MAMESLLDAINFISSPFETSSVWTLKATSPDPQLFLSQIVEKCREKMESRGFCWPTREFCSPDTAAWTFTTTILNILLQLKDEIEEIELNQTEEEKKIEVLSVKGQLDVGKSIELIFGFGLLPYLLKDVGIPEKVRKKHVLSEFLLLEDHQLSPLVKFQRLAETINVLLELLESSSLRTLIIPKHVADILSGLLQLCKSPIANPSSRPGSLNEEEYRNVMKQRIKLEIRLDDFVNTVPKTVLVSSLFLIGEKPKFMRDSCTQLMERMLQSKNGLITVSTTLLSESSASNVWSLARVVANLLRRSLIKRESNEESVKSFCDQCVTMISSAEKVEHEKTLSDQKARKSDIETKSTFSAKSGTKRELSRIGLFCSFVLMDINLEMSKTFIWSNLFRHVVNLDLSQHCFEMKPINENVSSFVKQMPRVDEDITFFNIDRAIAASEVAEGLLSLIIPLGISIPLHEFQPLWSLLFQFLVACRKYLERKVQEPNVSQLAQILKSKLESVFILLLEVVSSGRGDKLVLDITPSFSSDGLRNSPNPTASKVNSSVNNNISHERARSTCEFCVHLLVQDAKQMYGVNRFELMSVSNYHLEQCNAVQIVRVYPSREESIMENEFDVPSSSSGNLSSFQSSANIAFEVLEDECKILCSILKNERMEHITSQLFCQLLKYENEDFIEERNDDNSRRNAGDQKLASLSSPPTGVTDFPKNTFKSTQSTSNLLTQLEEGFHENLINKYSLRKFVTLKLLEELGEDDKTLENCVKSDDYKDTLLIVELVMTKLANELRESSCSGEDYEFSQTIVFALGFIGTVVETACHSKNPEPVNHSVSKNQFKKFNHGSHEEQTGGGGSAVDNNELWDELQRFLPHLRIIAESDNLLLLNSGIPSMAENILIGIETRGRVWAQRDRAGESVSSPYENAMRDVANPMLPIKGHGLLQLRRLIEGKDPETLKNDSKLFKLFQAELSNDDSYVYLMAIKGLACLGLKFHKIAIPLLIQEYDFVNRTGEIVDEKTWEKRYSEMTQSERINFRMKIGEVLMKVIQQLGDIAPMYRIALSNLFFRIVRDDEPLIRASALSNLGELCHLLKFSLGVVLTEVWYNLESILTCEKDIHVRRAALHLLVLLLKGVEKDFTPNHLLTDIDLGTHLRDVRRLLTKIGNQETDSVARTHAQLALHELELIVKKLCLPMQDLRYKIKVLDLFD